jgi:predicted XRE-type DNA-binding protein
MPSRHVTGKNPHSAKLEDAETATTKAVRVALAREIARIAADGGLTQCQAAELLGTTQPKVSALFAGKVEGFSLDRLVRFLNLLGEDIHIVVLPSAPEAARATARVMLANRWISSDAGWSYA